MIVEMRLWLNISLPPYSLTTPLSPFLPPFLPHFLPPSLPPSLPSTLSPKSSTTFGQFGRNTASHHLFIFTLWNVKELIKNSTPPTPHRSLLPALTIKGQHNWAKKRNILVDPKISRQTLLKPTNYDCLLPFRSSNWNFVVSLKNKACKLGVKQMYCGI